MLVIAIVVVELVFNTTGLFRSKSKNKKKAEEKVEGTTSSVE